MKPQLRQSTLKVTVCLGALTVLLTGCCVWGDDHSHDRDHYERRDRDMDHPEDRDRL